LPPVRSAPAAPQPTPASRGAFFSTILIAALAQLPTPPAAARAICVHSGLAGALSRAHYTSYTERPRGRDAYRSVGWHGTTQYLQVSQAGRAGPRTHSSARPTAAPSVRVCSELPEMQHAPNYASSPDHSRECRSEIIRLRSNTCRSAGRSSGPRAHSSARPTTDRLIRVCSTPECYLRIDGDATCPKRR